MAKQDDRLPPCRQCGQPWPNESALPAPHVHRFTVPVEWVKSAKTIKHHRADGNPPYSRDIPQWSVTKLRCETCSEEVSRG